MLKKRQFNIITDRKSKACFKHDLSQEKENQHVSESNGNCGRQKEQQQ